MLTIFEKILLGHLVADYLLQPEKMAVQKSAKGIKGLLICILHCVIYTVTICAFTSTAEPLKIGLIFLSHFPIDRWSLASQWLKLIKGRDFIAVYQNKPQYKEISLSFSTLVYAVVDNTWHLLFLALIFQCF
ncbi:MAG: DUF3307 domain-containing protein [Parcubacteria group bacterium]